MADAKDELRKEMQRAITGAAKSAVLGDDEETRAKRKRWVAIGAVAGGGLGLLFLWSMRPTFISVVALPLSLLASVLALDALGLTLDTMTLRAAQSTAR